MHETQEHFERALLNVDAVAAGELFRAAVRVDGTGALVAVDNLVVPALERIGRLWENGETSLAQVYMAGRICEDLVEDFLPPRAPERMDQPTMAIGVLEDHHQLGKRIVYASLRAAGYELIDLGHGLSVETMARRAAEEDVRLLMVSALMLNAALHVADLVERLRREAPETKIVVGGAPFLFDPNLWREVGADAMGRSAADALEIAAAFAREATL